MTTVGFRGRRPPAGSGFVIPIGALRTLRDAGVLATAEFRKHAGRVEFRIGPDGAWRPIEEAGPSGTGPVQLSALPGAGKENP